MDDLILCECGSNKFELIKVVQISKFWKQEIVSGRMNREPGYVKNFFMLKCIKCGGVLC